MELKYLTLAQKPEKSDKRSCLKRCLFRNSKVTPLTTEQRTQLAISRWEKVSKLRTIIGSISEARNQATFNIHTTIVPTDPNEELMITESSRKQWIIYPWETWKLNFDILVALLIFYYSLSVPYRIAFLGHENNSKIFVHEIIFEIVMLADIIIRFFTAYVDNYETVDDHRMICKKYVRGMFIFDVLAVFPYFLIRYYLLWFKIGRVLRINSLFESIENTV